MGKHQNISALYGTAATPFPLTGGGGDWGGGGTHQGMSLHVLAAGEQLATDVAAEGAHPRVDDQVPLQGAPVLGNVVTMGALELIDG